MRKDADTATTTYIETLATVNDAGLLKIEERLRTAGRWGINIGPNEGRLIALLARSIAAKRAVEIGTLFGYSSVWIARSLVKGGHLWTFERDPVAAQAARQGFIDCGLENQIDLLEGEALDQLQKFEQAGHGPLDLVFIDANKSGYLDYLDWAERNLRSGGLLIADNVFLGGAVFADQALGKWSLRQIDVMREFNRRLMSDEKFNAAVVPTAEGLLVASRV